MKITSIKQQVKRADRYSIYVDGKYAFSLGEAALLDQKLASGQELNAQQLASLKEVSGADKAYGNALRYAAMRLRSEWELRTYLQRKKVEEPVAEDILAKLRRIGFLDDMAFAKAWVANRHVLKSTSRRKLQLELKQKRVSTGIIEQVLREDEVDERDSLRQLVAKKRARYPDKIKFMQYLARQGFSYDDIKTVLDEPPEPSELSGEQ